MVFVFSFWYIVIAICVAAIVACVVFLFKMDKKDRVLINQFVESANESSTETAKEEVKVDESVEENK